MDTKEEAAGTDSGPLCNPDGGYRTGRVPSPPESARDPAFDCCCNDHCNGIVGSDHCNASTATYLDPACIPNGNFNRVADGFAIDDRDTDYADSDNGSDADTFNESGNGTARDSRYREPGYGET